MKKIGTTTYCHIDTVRYHRNQLTNKFLSAVLWIGEKHPELMDSFTIFKYNKKNNTASLIMSDNFDTAREPEVGDSYNVNLETGEIKIIKSKGQIYHHKWMFVPEDYNGFDITESKKWSETWQAVIPNDRKIKSRIGYKKYWDEYLQQYGLEIE